MTRRRLDNPRLLGSADRHDMRAACVEAAPGRWVQHAGDVAGQRFTLAPPPAAQRRMGRWYRGDQCFRVGVQRVGVQRPLISDLDDWPRYITATRLEMCFTTPRS